MEKHKKIRPQPELTPEAEQKFRTFAKMLAEKFDEPEIDLLYRYLACLPPHLAKKLAKRAIRRQGSDKPMMTCSGKRPRTVGGTFFILARPHIPKEYRRWSLWGQLTNEEIIEEHARQQARARQ